MKSNATSSQNIDQLLNFTVNRGDETVTIVKYCYYTILACSLIISAQSVFAAQEIPNPSKAGIISGNFTYCGETLSNLTVDIPGNSFSARTDQAGRFQLLYVPSGTYNLRVSLAGRVIGRLPQVMVTPKRITTLPSTDFCIDPANQLDFASNGLFNVPDGVTSIHVELWGAGGGGGGGGDACGNDQGGGGGGSGGYSVGDLEVNPGDEISISIGQSGTGGFAGGNGANGGNSSVQNIIAGGGLGGEYGADCDLSAGRGGLAGFGNSANGESGAHGTECNGGVGGSGNYGQGGIGGVGNCGNAAEAGSSGNSGHGRISW